MYVWKKIGFAKPGGKHRGTFNFQSKVTGKYVVVDRNNAIMMVYTSYIMAVKN